MTDDSLQARIEEAHGRYAQAVHALVEVRLPTATDERFLACFDGFSERGLFVPSVPYWALRLFDVQDGLTASYYHCRNVERLEYEVSEICLRALADPPTELPTTTMNFGARRLTYEYQAYVLALRRTFEYLAQGLAGWFGNNKPGSFRSLGKPLKQAAEEHAAGAKAITNRAATVITDFPEIFGVNGHSVRDELAHWSSVSAGTFTLHLKPGQPVSIELAGGAERLPFSEDLPRETGRLAAVLLDRLSRVEATVFELIDLLPGAPTAASRNRRLASKMPLDTG